MAEPNSSISNFKRFLTRILLPLILIVCLAGVCFDYFFEQKVIMVGELSGAYKVNRILKETHPDEIPIFGSSRAEGGYIPDSLGQHCFNYGLPGAKCDVLLFFLEEECKKTKNTPFIIINFDLVGLIYGQGDIASYIPNSNYPSVKQVLGKKYKKQFSIPFVRYYGRYESYMRNYLSNKIELTKRGNKGAALEINPLPKAEFDAMVADRSKRDSFTTDSILKTRLLSTIAANPTRTFIFVITPYHRSYFEKYKKEVEEIAFVNLLRSYKNIRVFDLSRLDVPDDMFFNPSHVNYKGAMYFSHCLKDSLVSIGIR